MILPTRQETHAGTQTRIHKSHTHTDMHTLVVDHCKKQKPHRHTVFTKQSTMIKDAGGDRLFALAVRDRRTRKTTAAAKKGDGRVTCGTR